MFNFPTLETQKESNGQNTGITVINFLDSSLQFNYPDLEYLIKTKLAFGGFFSVAYYF
jgi:hypothetical protein